MNEKHEFKPVRLNDQLFGVRAQKVDPAYRQITEGLLKQVDLIVKDPGKIGISCCVEGCCVSWCCVQMS